ncbi:SDR family oxidoreductase [Pseudomonas sp. Pseu.R1]|uniref:SDR family oxidoreductase n=1 Tax=Pseudomonas sp. Pseu.R1 TaxID=3379818 RepID=UPI003B925719
MQTAFVTGVSQGFGKAMAQKLLDEGLTVFGCSRTPPDSLLPHERFHWAPLDLSDLVSLEARASRMLAGWGIVHFDLVFLNAGRFGPSPRPATDVSLSDFVDVLNLNLVANKALLDVLLRAYAIGHCVLSASIAGVRLRAGALSYAVSKAALNALAGVYALEHPHTVFAVVGLCNLHTRLLRDALAGEHVDGLADFAALRERARNAAYVTSPAVRAEQLWTLYRQGFEHHLTSGIFQDIREVARFDGHYMTNGHH